MISQDVEQEYAIAGKFLRPAGSKAWILIAAVGALIYAAVYIHAEALVLDHAKRNRLFMINTAPRTEYDYVVLGASHAMPFDFEDMNQRLEEATGSNIINLSIEGAGPLPMRFMTEYFLAGHSTRHVLYIVDSFAFYSEQWNEVRIDDPELLARAPFDWSLLGTLWQFPAARGLIPGYLTGFYKINNRERFAPDVSEAEQSRFTRTYRTNARVDERRMAFLYPETIDQQTFDTYLAEFEQLTQMLHQRGIELVAVKTPLPERVLSQLQSEEKFNARIRGILAAYDFELHDFSGVANDDAFFYDTDHLNRDGVINFMDSYLAPLLRDHAAER